VVDDCCFRAAGQGRIDDTKKLLKRGIKVDRTTKAIKGDLGGCTALYSAASGGWNEIMKTLLEKCANADKAGDNGATPLLIASQLGDMDVVKWLVVEGKAEVDKAADGDWAPLETAKA
jgi:ankyrin repeat protein